jgi:protein phosphatase 1 regulatory subunit 7
MQSNRTTKLEGLEDLEELDQLYLSHNGIEKMEGLEKNVSVYSPFHLPCDLTLICSQTRITTLDLGANFITQIENISHLSQLEELWVNRLLNAQPVTHVFPSADKQQSNP